MAVKIRLKRMGKKRNPVYRIVVALEMVDLLKKSEHMIQIRNQA